MTNTTAYLSLTAFTLVSAMGILFASSFSSQRRESQKGTQTPPISLQGHVLSVSEPIQKEQPFALLYTTQCSACSLISIDTISQAAKIKKNRLVILTKPDLVAETEKITGIPVHSVASFLLGKHDQELLAMAAPQLLITDGDGRVVLQNIGVEMINQWSQVKGIRSGMNP